MDPAQDLRKVLIASLPGVAWQHMGTDVAWVAMATVDDWRPWLRQAADLLSDAEQERVARKRRPEDRDTLVLAYAMHRLLLSRWLDVDAAQVPIGRDAQGRPLILDSVLCTSLSHTNGAIAIAIANALPVGVDIEAIVRPSLLDDIAAQICHPSELAALETLTDELRQADLLRLWVRKEAYLKAVGVGLAWDMSSFVAAPGVLMPVPGSSGGEALQVRLSAVPMHPGFEVACAAPAQCRTIDFMLLPGAAVAQAQA